MHKLQEASPQVSGKGLDRGGSALAPPPEVHAVLARVEQLLQDGQPRQALEVLARSKASTSWITNATGVCLLRLGEADRAVELFRPLVLSGSLLLRADVPTAWKVNFATALLLADNLPGCLQALWDVKDESHPGVQRLRAAIRQWQSQLSVWEKVVRLLGGQLAKRVEIDFPPGEL